MHGSPRSESVSSPSLRDGELGLCSVVDTFGEFESLFSCPGVTVGTVLLADTALNWLKHPLHTGMYLSMPPMSFVSPVLLECLCVK